jgi:hypothetical protein
VLHFFIGCFPVVLAERARIGCSWGKAAAELLLCGFAADCV